MAVHVEPGMRADLLQQVDVAEPALAEVEVLADDNRFGPEAADEHRIDELLGRLTGPRFVEGNDDHGVEPGVGQQLDLVIETRQQFGRQLGSQHPSRVGIERDQRRLRTEIGSEAFDPFDHRSVPDVHAVEHPDREGVSGVDRTTGGSRVDPPPGLRRGVGDDVHSNRTYRVTNRPALWPGTVRRHEPRRPREAARLAL